MKTVKVRLYGKVQGVNFRVMVQKILDESKQVLGNFSKDKKTFNADDFSFPFKQDPEQAADYAKIFFGMSKPNYYTTEDYIRIFESQRYVLELAAAVKLFYLENNKLPSCPVLRALPAASNP